MGGPVHWNIGFGRDEFAVGAVNHIEKTVLWRLHNDFTWFLVDLDIGQDHMLSCCVVPGIAGSCLVVPNILTVIRIQGHDRRQEQIIAAAWAANVTVPGRAVAGAYVQ